MDPLDHRAIGNEMDLFHQQEEGAGQVFWHPRGFALYQVVESYVRKRMRQAGFREVRTPQLLARGLWEQSGHWEKFGENMFALDDGHQTLALKPMSCPGHIQIFNKRVRSFRDLPLRLAEFGACHRNEPSGALQGLMRTRAFVQDDAHVFCAPEQIAPEVARFCGLLRQIYADFGFDEMIVGFSTRPELRAGEDDVWDQAEAALEQAARSAGVDYRQQPGEGAFYGPKLDFSLRDSRGREWQCGTVQVDLVLPERLDAAYVDSDNSRRCPVILHHAVLGSIERFIGVLLEHHQGRLPLWLAPEQIMIASIAEAQAGYAAEVADLFAEAGYRPALDTRPIRLPRKIVDAHAAGIPLLAAVGAREAASDSIALRGAGADNEVVAVDAALGRLRSDAFR